MLGTWEILAICFIVLLIFGGKKIPEIARGLGKGLREFQKAKEGITDSVNEAVKEKPVDKKEKESKNTKEKL